MTNPLYDALFAPHATNEATFIETVEGAKLSYSAFISMVGRYAGALADLGVQPGDRVAVQVEKSVEALAVYGAAQHLGAVFLPLNTAYTPKEIAYFLGDAEPRVFVADPARQSELISVADAAGATLVTLDEAGQGTLADRAGQSEAPAVATRGADDLAAILYTSGTTGRSKGAMLSQNNLLSNTDVLVAYWRFTDKDMLLHALPIFHTHGLFVATNVTLRAGGALLWMPKFNAEKAASAIPRVTSMMGVPTFYTRLLDEPAFTKDACAKMRLFTSGSAPLLAETHRAFEARTGHRILERYGMTETNMNTSNPYDGARKAGAVGFPLPGVELKVVDPDTGAILPDGEIGVIEVRGPNVFLGYWRMPEKTAEELRPDGWFITGDLGMIDAEGYVVIVGRGKDLIITGGFNVYPKEVETAIDDLPGVLESAVIGVPHPDFGEGVVAVVVAERGASVEGDSVKAGLADQLAKFKQPKTVIVADALPRNTMGKVQKNVLRDTHKAMFAKV